MLNAFHYVLSDIDIDYDKIPANEANLDEFRQKYVTSLKYTYASEFGALNYSY